MCVFIHIYINIHSTHAYVIKNNFVSRILIITINCLTALTKKYIIYMYIWQKTLTGGPSAQNHDAPRTYTDIINGLLKNPIRLE